MTLIVCYWCSIHWSVNKSIEWHLPIKCKCELRPTGEVAGSLGDGRRAEFQRSLDCVRQWVRPRCLWVRWRPDHHPSRSNRSWGTRAYQVPNPLQSPVNNKAERLSSDVSLVQTNKNPSKSLCSRMLQPSMFAYVHVCMCACMYFM